MTHELFAEDRRLALATAAVTGLALNATPPGAPINWTLVDAVEISPVAEADCEFRLATAETADGWSLYARLDSGEAVLLHDAPNVRNALRTLMEICRAAGIRRIAWNDDELFTRPMSPSQFKVWLEAAGAGNDQFKDAARVLDDLLRLSSQPPSPPPPE